MSEKQYWGFAEACKVIPLIRLAFARGDSGDSQPVIRVFQ